MTQKTQIEKKPQVEATETQSIDSDFDKLLAKEKSLELSSFNQETYDQLFRLAEVMADSGVVPDSLRTEGNASNKKELPRNRVVANCFLVAEQAHRWEMSPFTILGEAAIVHGKLGWEGKTINALIQKFSGVYLKFEYNDKSGDDLEVTVVGKLPNENEPRTVPGSVKSWKTTGTGSPWKMSDNIALKRQLSYRGAREWMRIHLPSVMHGVLAIDEIQDFSDNASKPTTPVVTREQIAEKVQRALPESKSKEKEESFISDETLIKIDQAWKALGKSDDDILTACEHVGSESVNFSGLYESEAKKLLLILQKQMNKQAGKTQGQIEKEFKLKAAR